MCDCGGELTDWCFDCSDWVCDECGCPSSFDHDPFFNDEPIRCTCPVGNDAIGPHVRGCPNHPEHGR